MGRKQKDIDKIKFINLWTDYLIHAKSSHSSTRKVGEVFGVSPMGTYYIADRLKAQIKKVLTYKKNILKATKVTDAEIRKLLSIKDN